MSSDQEIPHDVDAHLLGGIPRENVNDLHVLQAVVPDVLENSLKEIRKGYVELTKPIDELKEEVLQHPNVIDKTNQVAELTQQFLDKYWDILRAVDKNTDINELMGNMLTDVKQLLSEFKYVDTYDGYQIIADIWKDSLTTDLEIISEAGFYTAGRMRVPKMVSKGSGNSKREVQEGWEGSIIPTDLISEHLFSYERQKIEDLKSEVQEIESELNELVELAKDENSEESEYLLDAVKKDSEGEPGDSFESKSIKAELKNYSKEELGYELLSKVEGMLSKRSRLNRDSKALSKELNEKVQERIINLSDEEIDSLVYVKWFGEIVEAMIKLVRNPISKDLDTLGLLFDRYKDTLDDLDKEIRELEKAFEELASQLVVQE